MIGRGVVDPAPVHGGPPSKPSGGWAAITAANSQKWETRAPPKKVQPKKVRIPQALWVADTERNPALFNIADPLERYTEVNKFRTAKGVIDLHFQSTRTVTVVLDSELPKELAGKAGKAWVITGTGHHVSKNTHQKAGAVRSHPLCSHPPNCTCPRLLLFFRLTLFLRLSPCAPNFTFVCLFVSAQLFPSVQQYLDNEGYSYAIGVDKQGKAGAFLVHGI
jgi:hypothetical protein